MLGFLGKWASSKGMTRIPNLEGLLRPDARNAILNSGLNVGNEIPLSNAQGATEANNNRAKARIDTNDLINYESFLDFEYFNFTPVAYSFTPYSFTPTAFSFTPYSFTPTAYSFTPVPPRTCCEGGCTSEDIVEIYQSEEFCSEISECLGCEYYGGLSCTIYDVAEYCDGSFVIVGSSPGPNNTGPIREPSNDAACGCGTYSFTPYSFTPYSFTPVSCSPNEGQDCFGPDGCPGQIGCNGLCQCATPPYSFTPQAYSFTPQAFTFTPYSFTPYSFTPSTFSFTPQFIV
jgi:hypothetical protein